MANGICDTGKTILDFADTRPGCRKNPAGIGVGNVESTPIGLVRNGAQVEGGLPESIGRAKCATVNSKPVEGPC